MSAPSVNEITRKVEAAAKAAGWPIGFAVDLGCASAWLSRQGIDAMPACLRAIRETPEDPSSTLAQSVSAIDAALSTPETSVQIAPLLEPLILLGFCGSAASQTEQALTLKGAINAEICAGRLIHKPEFAPSAATTHLTARPDNSRPTIPSHRTPPDEQAWAEMTELAAKLLVPATPASRAFGAGADGKERENF